MGREGSARSALCFPKATAADRRLYGVLQLDWHPDAEYLLGTRLRRRPTHAELFADVLRNQNGLRFRAYFAMKYPHRVLQRCRSGNRPGG